MATVKTPSVRVDVHHLTRVEGHGNIVVEVSDGVLKRCDLEIIEAPRFFESMLRGRPIAQVANLVSRICGICAVAHTTTALRALESALGVELSPQTVLLRRLNYHAEMLDSHILHAYMLVAPDFLGEGSVIPLARTAPEVVLRALRMKKLAGDVCEAVAGRHTHPIAMTIGGFTHFPTADQLASLCRRMEDMRPDVAATVELFQGLAIPDFERDTEYLALHRDDMYGFIDGRIASTDGGSWPVEDYLAVTNEYQVSHSAAKHARHQRDSYMVGALARYNLNHAQLHPAAQSAAAALGLAPICANPYMNTVAQVVEIAHCVEESIDLMEQLLERGIKREDPAAPTRLSGEGVGACEAPRGTLYHYYRIGSGYVTDANCIIPTAQNLANIEGDMRALVPALLDQGADGIKLALEMLVRAYDPCISCATHVVEVRLG